MKTNLLAVISANAQRDLLEKDTTLHSLLVDELHRQSCTLALVASCSVSDLAVLACEGMFLDNVTAEGYPGARYHAGCRVIDDIERLAVSRACKTYGARYANVQPLSASIANQVVIASEPVKICRHEYCTFFDMVSTPTKPGSSGHMDTLFEDLMLSPD
ncbi:hypothetical protein D8B25_19945, partial [Verminephrobacter aporrectodeae subsp. tuberculatae]|nr:hypothetical protein [Verminephrobacter aporrectodeae subsp. tuberculatae]